MSTRHPTHTEKVEAQREELRDYQALLERLGTPRTFVEIAHAHRVQCAQNYADTHERIWFEKLELLAAILHQENSAPEDRWAPA